MCEPVTIALAASAALGAVGTIQAGEAQADAAEYNQAVANNNAVIATQNAETERERGAEEERRHRQRVAQTKGSQRAAFAGNGILLDEGSPLDILMDTEEMGELDAQTILHDSELRARNFDIQSSNFTGQAGLLGAQASGARSGSYLAAAGGLLGGVSDVSTKWDAYKSKPKPFSNKKGSAGAASSSLSDGTTIKWN